MGNAEVRGLLRSLNCKFPESEVSGTNPEQRSYWKVAADGCQPDLKSGPRESVRVRLLYLPYRLQRAKPPLALDRC